MSTIEPNTVSFDTGMLSFTRSFQITEGFFWGVIPKTDYSEARRIPIEVVQKGVRGQTSEGNLKKPQNAGKSNPQVIEFAAVPPGCTSLELEFSVRVLPNAMKPGSCDSPLVTQSYARLASEYAKRDGFKTLAGLYIWNIANGRFAWRNRYQTDHAEVHVNDTLVFNPFHPVLSNLEKPVPLEEMVTALVKGTKEDLDALVVDISNALQSGSYVIRVKWVAAAEPGQEVFPSQEYLKEEAKTDLTPGRVYAKLATFFGDRVVHQASMHSQKIGAAFRFIDIWHGAHGYGAIPVNPYGGVQETGEVLRKATSANNMYALRTDAAQLLSMVEKAESGQIPGEAHFIMANLLRGGVYGKSAGKAEGSEEGSEGEAQPKTRGRKKANA